MSSIKSILPLSIILLSVSSIIAGPKKRTTMELNENCTNPDSMMVDEVQGTSIQSAKVVHVTTRKQEEDHYYSQLRSLTEQRCTLEIQYHPDSEQYEQALGAIAQSFALLEIKGKQLREEIHPAMDLQNKDWDTETYWQ